MSASVLFAGGQQEDSNVIVIASDATWPPMEFLDENKEIIGFDVDLINAAAKAGGFEVKIVNTAWDGIFAGLANGNYDAVMSSVTITEERKGAMDFSVPYINAGQVLIVGKDSKGMTTLADMAGKSLGAQIGTTGAIAISDAGNIELKTYDELGLAIEDLANGNIDGVVADSPIAADYVLGNDNYKAVLKIVGEPFTDEFHGVAVKKGNSEVLAKLNKGLEAVIASGERDELINKWLR
jgi:polar amino acid transport system substrate-binding protein